MSKTTASEMQATKVSSGITAQTWESLSTDLLLMPQLLEAWHKSNGEKVLLSLDESGNMVKPLSELQAFLESSGGKLVFQMKERQYYKLEGGFADLDWDEKNGTASVSGSSLDPAFKTMMATIKSDYLSEVKKNLVYTIVHESDEYKIRNLGYGAMPLIKENYTPDVVEDIDFVLKSFLKNPPHGRICILNGEPGTGKTFCIRSMLSEIDCIFLLVPSSLVDQMDKPELLPLLMNVSQAHKKPLIMVIEDGDVCLVPRENDNISSITSLLNLSDGILGSMLDIKMIISTNASIKDMDQAIMRPGRLCRQIQVGALPYDQALAVFRRISENQEAELEYCKRGYTLAEIYSFANKASDEKSESSVSDDLAMVKPSVHYGRRRSIGFQQADTASDLTVNLADSK